MSKERQFPGITEEGLEALRARIGVKIENTLEPWCYEASPVHQFFSNYISGADRLWSGSVLVCEGSSGRLFEVTREQEVVWEWINPFVNFRRTGEIALGIYRAHRYSADHPAFAGRDLDPAAHGNLNRLNGLM